MNMHTFAFLLGSALLLVGIFGSGIEMKGLKIGKVGGSTRALSIGLGLLFITLGLWMADKLPVKRSGVATSASENRQLAESDKTEALTSKKGDAGQELIDNGFEGASTSRFYWNKGESIGGKAGQQGFQKVYIDQSVGAENSKQSLVMEFKFGYRRTLQYKNEKIKVRIKYRISRDLSNYRGIRFYVKSDQTMKLLFYLVEKDIKSINWNRWFFELIVTEQWKSVDIPFDRLKNVNDKGGDRDSHQTLALKNTDSFDWLVNERMLPPGSHGKIWLDQLRLY